MTQLTEVTDRETPQGEPGTHVDDVVPARARWAVRAVVLLAVLVGVGLHLWYLFHVPINSDESIVGLMARDILHGHFTAFYWGQPYGGGEPYVVAALFGLFGESALTLSLTPLLLAAVSALLVWRIVRRVAGPGLAALAGALAWLGPDVMTANATREYGFRGVTLVCGLACVLFALRLLDDGFTWLNCVGLGLATGLGWWSSPEVVYFVIPAGLIALGACRVHRPAPARWLPRVAAALGAFALGALPWIWANVLSGGASLKPANFPGGSTSTLNAGYGTRLGDFFRFSLLIDVDLRRVATGSDLVHGAWGVVLAVLVFVAIGLTLLACLLRWDRASAFGVALLAFPFVFAAQPGTWFWNDGRYVVFLSPLLAVVVSAGIAGMARWRWWSKVRRPRLAEVSLLAMSAVVTVAGVLTVGAFTFDNGIALGAVGSGWSHPDGSVDRSIAILEAHGVHDGYADYWVAYTLDLLSRGQLTVSPEPGDVLRSRALEASVSAARQQAWLFVPTSELVAGYREFSVTSVIAGPRGIDESGFVAALQRLGIAHRTVRAGILDAVIPSRPVSVAQVQAAGG